MGNRTVDDWFYTGTRGALFEAVVLVANEKATLTSMASKENSSEALGSEHILQGQAVVETDPSTCLLRETTGFQFSKYRTSTTEEFNS
jgi:hypothetical protein